MGRISDADIIYSRLEEFKSWQEQNPDKINQYLSERFSFVLNEADKPFRVIFKIWSREFIRYAATLEEARNLAGAGLSSILNKTPIPEGELGIKVKSLMDEVSEAGFIFPIITVGRQIQQKQNDIWINL